MSYPPAPPQLLKVGVKTFYSVLYLVFGILSVLIGVLTWITGGFSVFPIIGVLFIVAGSLSFTMPAFTYEYATGALYMHSMFGNRARTYGPPKGERLWFDGTNLLRIKVDGKQKRVNLRVAKPEEVAQLLQAITATQQQAQQVQ